MNMTQIEIHDTRIEIVISYDKNMTSLDALYEALKVIKRMVIKSEYDNSGNILR